MSIPDYQTLMLPLLKITADRKEYRFRDIVERLALEFQLTEEERSELLPSGTQPVFNNRVGWARTYLKQAGLHHSPKRGLIQITERGIELLNKNPSRIDVKLLQKYKEFRDFRTRHRTSENKKEKDTDTVLLNSQTPEEVLATAFQKLQKNLEGELLDQVKASSPSFFERLVIDLLVAMGYGGSRQDAGRAVGHSGDGGIDGIIKEDKLGLDLIYIQAKRWENTVSRPEIQKFAGALQGQRANKGVFITTSNFSREAEDYVSTINSKIILIDGERLAKLMIDHNIGVSPVDRFEIKKIDFDYFEM